MWKNLNKCNSFLALKGLPKVNLASVLTPERIASYSIPLGSSLHYNYAAKQVDETTIEALQALADEQMLIEKYKAVLRGEVINTGENRLVLHHLTRDRSNSPLMFNGTDMHKFYLKELEKISVFVERIHSGDIRSSSGKRFTDVVQLGIGGSDLGPRCLYIALKEFARSKKLNKMKAHFISNVDPTDANSILYDIEPSSTLFILVSKSGTTEETLANKELVLKYLNAKGIEDIEKNFVVVTSSSSPLAKDPSYLQSFFMDDFIGGRYSSSSACGALILSLSFGNELFASFLEGAHQVDKNALLPSIKENAPLMDALIGVYERNILGYTATAVLPYTQELARFPAHLQQLDMESSGKAVNRDFEPIFYPTGPIIFGEPGTNGQHSFYQFLHQSNEVIPLQFIAFKDSSISMPIEMPKEMEDYYSEVNKNHKTLLTNLIAQIYALAVGKADSNKNKHFEGGRPSSLIYGDALNGKTLGSLLAHYENKVMFQGFLWNINSFDQEGVQLGKVIAKKIAKGDADDCLKAYTSILLT